MSTLRSIVALLLCAAAPGAVAEVHDPPFLFLHDGKAGGGTVRLILQELGFLTYFHTCHPSPCDEWWSDENRTQYKCAPRFVIIPVRSPVERFKSAFDWRNVLQCRKEDTREPGKKYAQAHPTEGCVKGEKMQGKSTELTVDFLARYDNDANVLAEALCDTNNSVAQADMKSILHARYSLADWLPPRLLSTAHVYAMPMGTGLSFVDVIRSTGKQLVNDYNRFVQLGDNCTAQSAVRAKIRIPTQNPMTYSSTAHSSAEHPRSSSVLSQRGMRCVTRYYSQDYKVLAYLRDVACLGPLQEDCRAAINEMLTEVTNV